jgi:predicted phosphodiesterase
MRIAALSDIHGNLAALDAVLEDIQSQGVDLIVNLGDIASGPLQPSETVDRLMALNLPTIRGNHERQLLAGDPSRMGASDQYAFAELRPDQLAWFASLPAHQYISEDVLLVHGSVESDVTYFVETLEEDGCRAATHDEVLSRAGNANAKLKHNMCITSTFIWHWQPYINQQKNQRQSNRNNSSNSRSQRRAWRTVQPCHWHQQYIH